MTASTATALRVNDDEGRRDEFHRRSVAALHAAEVPFLIGGAYMVEVCGGVSRSTKDFDLYIRPKHAANPPNAKNPIANSSAIALVRVSVPRDIFVTNGSSK